PIAAMTRVRRSQPIRDHRCGNISLTACHCPTRSWPRWLLASIAMDFPDQLPALGSLCMAVGPLLKGGGAGSDRPGDPYLFAAIGRRGAKEVRDLLHHL